MSIPPILPPKLAVLLRPTLFVLFLSLTALRAVADEPVWESSEAATVRIDAFIQQRWMDDEIKPAKACGDREFVRRVYLDLVGRIPKCEEVDAFLEDNRKDKRRHLVHQLTESDAYARHFAETFDTLMMGRGSERDYQERTKHGWRDYLQRAFAQNRPWDEVIQEVLVARPTDADENGSVWFLYERENNAQEIAEAIAPAVFGIRIECAQCHDHPLADEIEQAHYWGLVAFYNRGKNTQTKNGPRVSESAIGGFSEFADLTGESQPNLLTFFRAETVEEARPEKGIKQQDKDEFYRASDIDGDPRIPKFSRREKFAQRVAASHPLIARAMVNRLWAMLLGRGLVHPFDEMDSVHEPSHPELLDWLTQEYRDSGFDTRRLVRAIASSRAYQLASLRPQDAEDPATFAWYLERPLTAEQLARSIQLAVRSEIQDGAALIGPFRQTLREVMPDESVTTIKESLFLTNNSALNQFLQASDQPDHLVPQLASLKSASEKVDHLFQTVLARHPDQQEERAVIQYVLEHDDDERWNQVLWSLLTSAEFRFNH